VNIDSSDTFANVPDTASQTDQQPMLDSTTSDSISGFGSSPTSGPFAPPDPIGFSFAPEPATFGIIGLVLCGVGIALRRKA
jgi:hypothetical protein